MPRQFTAPITYFLQEGKENLEECLKIAFQAAERHSIDKIVIFTARGEGVRLALDKFCSLQQHVNVQLVAVSFPQGKEFTDQNKAPVDVVIPREVENYLRSKGVPIVRAHLPFDPIVPVPWERGALGQDLNLVGNALNMFGGSMSLCIQAVVLACDSGAVGIGEHVIALTSDTAILAQATSTRRMLSELVVREILCKPVILSIGREESAPDLIESPGEPELTGEAQKSLPQAEPNKPS